MDDDFENSLCDSESERESESEASWDSEAEVSETDFGLESECLGSEPIKSGSRSKTAVESTTYNKSRSQPAKPDGSVITHAHSYVTDSSRSTSVAPPAVDDLFMELINDKIHEIEECHCVRPKHPDKVVRFEE